MAIQSTWLLALSVHIGPDLNSNLAKKTASTASSAEVDSTKAEKCGGGFGRGSREAQGAGGGGESANRCGEDVVKRIGEREEEEEEEEDPQQVGGENGEAVGVLQGCADGGETHVVTKGVAEDWAHQVTCNREERRRIKGHILFSSNSFRGFSNKMSSENFLICIFTHRGLWTFLPIHFSDTVKSASTFINTTYRSELHDPLEDNCPRPTRTSHRSKM